MTDTADDLLESHKFSPDGRIWAPETLKQVRDRLEYIDAHECDCGETPHEDALHDLAHDDVPVLLKIIERLAPRRIETAADLDALPKAGTVVRADDGEFYCSAGLMPSGETWWTRFDFEKSHKTSEVALPATVLWSPEAAR